MAARQSDNRLQGQNVGETLLAKLVRAIATKLLSDAAKDRIKEWLRAMPVKDAIQKTADTFSTRPPGAADALALWVKSDAFLATLEEVQAGKRPAPDASQVDLFVDLTGLALGMARREAVLELLQFFYRKLHENLLRSKEGLPLIDKKLDTQMQEIRELRAQFRVEAGTGKDRAIRGFEVTSAGLATPQITARALRHVISIARHALQELARTEQWPETVGYARDA